MKTARKLTRGFFQGCAVAFLFALVAETWSARGDDGFAWKSIAEGGAVVEIAPDNAVPATGQNTNSLRLTVKNVGQRAGIVSGPAGEASLEAGRWCDLSFEASTDLNKHFALTVSLESPDGKLVAARATLPEVGGALTKYHLALNVRQSAPKYRMVITMAETGSIWLNAIALVPRDKN